MISKHLHRTTSQRSVDSAWTDAIDADILRCKIDGGRFGELTERSFSHSVGAGVPFAYQTLVATHDDDTPALIVLEVGDSVLERQEGPSEIDLDDVISLFQRSLEDITDGMISRISKDSIEFASLGDSLG
jgi:hypothetical protein